MKDINPAIEVHRTWSLESRLAMQHFPALLNRYLHINPEWFNIPDQYAGWLPFALWKGLRIVQKEKIDVIFSTSLPNTCHLVANILKRRTGLPWVADLQDLWTQNPYASYPAPVRRLQNKMEKAVIKTTDRITVINYTAKQDLMSKYPGEPAEKFEIITHGFDPQDLPAISSKRKPLSGKFTITFTGSLYGRIKVDTFMYAVKELIDENRALGDHLNIRFVGGVSPAEKLSQQLGLHGIVTTQGWVTHQEVWNYMAVSNVLLLVLGVGEHGEKASTGKLPEYMVSGKPILALVPEGVAAGIIRETNIGIIVNPEDKEGIKQAIHDLYIKWLSGNLSISQNKEAIEQYNITRLAKRFAAIFDELADTK
jgi:glycosyltransferase involved in cell wall biosynthesis